MFKISNIVKIIIIIIPIIFFSFNFDSLIQINKKYFSEDVKYFFKKYIFFTRTINNLEKEIKFYKDQLGNRNFAVAKLEYQNKFIKNYINNGALIGNKKILTSNKKINNIKTFLLLNSNFQEFENEKDFRGEFFISVFENRIIVTFSNGNQFYFNKADLNFSKLNIYNAQNNIKDFFLNNKDIEYENFPPSSKILSSLIIDNNIYLSYLKKKKDDCYTVSVIYSEINFDKKFIYKNFFEKLECVSIKVTANSAGGKMLFLPPNNLFLTIGDQITMNKAQDVNSIFGKNIIINLKDGSYKKISMGHKNSQGAAYSNKHNLIFFSEHQAQGGCEINMINLNENNKIYNFGWPVASYGIHYDWMSKKIKKQYLMYKSHEKHGFDEPLIYFPLSIAPTQLIIQDENSNEINFFLATLKEKSLLELKYNIKEKKMTLVNKIFLNDRIRDIHLIEDKLLLAFEKDPSLGIIEFLKN
jgi:hypothetical protein